MTILGMYGSSQLAILGLIVVTLVGLALTKRRYFRVKKRLTFTDEYLKRFSQFADDFKPARMTDGSYAWLLENSLAMQREISAVTSYSYRPAFANYMISDYQVLLNTLPMFTQLEDRVDVRNAWHGADSCKQQMLMVRGEIASNTELLLATSRNPLRWFLEGIRAIVALPITLLNEFGVFSTHSVDVIKRSAIFRVVSGLIALSTLIASIVTIVVGWDQAQHFFQTIGPLVSP